MTKKIYSLLVISLLVLICFVFTSNSRAYNTPPGFNWGSTNIIDGIIPPPGLWLSSYILAYTSDDFKDGDGHDLPGDHDLDILGYVPQFIYVANDTLPGNLKYGIQAQLPIINYNLDSHINTPAGRQEMLSADSNMIGDLCIGPFFGRAEKLSQNWIFHWFFEFDVYAPTGAYDEDENLNPSSNYWSVEPFLSFTLQMPYGFTLSSRQMFNIYNSENDDYIAQPGAEETDLQVGNMYHFNYSLMKTLDFIDPKLRLGVVGYYGKQLEEDDIDDYPDPDEEQIFAIGPGIHWMHKGMMWSLKTYFESEAENRTEGTRVVFRIINHF